MAIDFKLSNTCRALLLSILVLGAVCAVVGLFFTSEKLSWVLGVAIGSVTAMIRVIMLESTIQKAVDMQKKDSEAFGRVGYNTRLLFTGAVIVAVAVTKCASLIGVIVGIVLVQPAAYITNFVIKPHENDPAINNQKGAV